MVILKQTLALNVIILARHVMVLLKHPVSVATLVTFQEILVSQSVLQVHLGMRKLVLATNATSPVLNVMARPQHLV